MIRFVFLMFLLNQIIVAQTVKLIGDSKPGNILIGEVKNAKSVYLDSTRIKVDPNGIFVFGFDRDDKGTHFLKVNYYDGKVELKKITLQERQFNIQKINNMNKKYISPPAKELERIAEERVIIKEARSRIGLIDTAFFSTGFIRPVSGGRISGIFGSQRILNGEPQNIHNGLDIAANKGTSVFASSDGIVRLAGNNFYYNGNFVLLDHGQGLSTIYLHLNKLNVINGQFIKKGEKIGEVGSTGRSTGPHLHWGVQWNDKRLDPESLLNLNFSFSAK